MSTPRPAASKGHVAFMSYAHHDNGANRLSKFRDRLVQELRSQTGTDVEIFMDSDDIELGEPWRRRLAEGLTTSAFLLPIITPSFLMSAYCRLEFESFCAHERDLGRDDLILPVYYVDCEDIRASAPDEPPAATASAVFERQYSDWRELRQLSPSNQRVRRELEQLAGQIKNAMARVVEPTRPPGAPRRIVPLPPAPPRRTPSDVLPECCVRIEVGGRHAGSGFFAAPGIVVTCYHVLRLGDLSSEESGANVSVISPTGRAYEVLDAREYDEQDDLAILRVEPANGHPFVLLETGFRARDRYFTFCFPEDAPAGSPLSLLASGWLEMDRTLRLADGQVRRGMSGCPVLNLRTGAVCGVLKRAGAHERGGDPLAAPEGQVVSVRRLFSLSPTLSSANFRHHTTHRDAWFDLLPPEQQRQLVAQRTSDPASLPDFLLVISVDQSGDEWEVSATVHGRFEEGDGWAAEPPIGPIKVDLNSVRALVARVFRDWASRDATEQGRVGPGEQIRLLGEILSRALLPAQIGTRFSTLIAGSDLGWIEVALHFSDVEDADFREFVQLPWEHLYVPSRGRRGDVYFAREPKLAFVRTLHPDPETPEPPADRLSMLVVAVKPADQDRPDEGRTAGDVDVIAAGLMGLGTALSGALDVTVIESPGFDGLAEAVTSGRYDVVHYIGFGRFDTGSDDRIALAIDPSGRVGYNNARDFADCLEGATMPRLVVLQVCRDAETVPADLSAFGPALLMKARCQAVVAYQYPVKGELTQKFNAALYGALVDGTPLEMATQVARKKVWSSDSEGRAFLSPAVFVRNPGGLRLAPAGPEAASRSRVGALSGHA